MAFNITWSEFPEPNITAGFHNMTEYANIVTNYYFAPAIFISLWVIFYLIFRKGGQEVQGLLASSAIMAAIGAVMRSMGLISDPWFVAPLVLTLVSMLLLNRKTD